MEWAGRNFQTYVGPSSSWPPAARHFRKLATLSIESGWGGWPYLPRLSLRSHLWVAPDERVSVAEVFLGRLVAGVGGPARFHVTAKGDGGVGAPVEEVDEETASSALNSCSEQALASLWHLDCSSHSSLWSIQGMNELTKASDVTSEPKSDRRSRLSPTNYHFRRSRQLQWFGYRGVREIIFLNYGNTVPNKKIKMSVNKVEILNIRLFGVLNALWVKEGSGIKRCNKLAKVNLRFSSK